MSNPLRIQLAHSPADAALISQVFDEVWSVKTMVSPEIIVASLHNGAYGSVVWDGDVPVAAAFAIVGKSLTAQPSELNLHSHAAGVVQSHAGMGLGTRLKMHQWQWARENGFATITWSFDPLVRRNAWFNMVKLGANVTNYFQNFYGELDDGINAGEQSDRVLVRWQVLAAGEPQSLEVVTERDGDVVIATPEDIESLRKTDKADAQVWRAGQRAAFEEAIGNGFAVRGLNAEYSYVLSRGNS
jgi:predicted GNAT superfamily acetyltransferase